MKHALILHGTGDNPQKNWFPWLSNQLEENGYTVWAPQLPGSDKPNIARYNEFLLANPEFVLNEETLLIGHSSGAVATLGLLQALPEGTKVAGCYLVAAFKDDLGWEALTELHQPTLVFEKIVDKANRFVFVHSDNDPFCSLDHAEYLSQKVNGELIILKDQKHFSIGNGGSQYSEFPFLFDLITQNYPVPFFGNTPDNTHCFQAAIKMVAKKYFPNEDFSWSELDTITAKKEGLWTWPTAGLLWLQQKGLELKDIEIFDFSAFVKEGGEYLIRFLGEEVGQEQIKWSDIPQEQELLRQALDQFKIEARIPDLSDLKQLLAAGHVLICNINANALENKEGYVGHFVVVFDADETGFRLHDPGLPSMPNIHVSYEQFEKAWAYPDEKTKNVVAIRKNS